MNVQVYSGLQHISHTFHFANISFKSLPRKWVRCLFSISSFSVQPNVQTPHMEEQEFHWQKGNQLHKQKYSNRNFLNWDFFFFNLNFVKVPLKVIHIFSNKNYDGAAASTITINSRKKLLRILLVLQPPARVPHNSRYLGWEWLHWSNTNTFDTASTPSLCRGACAYPL